MTGVIYVCDKTFGLDYHHTPRSLKYFWRKVLHSKTKFMLYHFCYTYQFEISSSSPDLWLDSDYVTLVIVQKYLLESGLTLRSSVILV